MRFGHFTAEALQAFAEAKGLDTKNQDFSEGVFDFKICEKPNGKFYGIPNQGKCKAPNREAAARPDTGFLNSQQGKAINYDTAKSQGDAKTQFSNVISGLNKGPVKNIPAAMWSRLPLDKFNNKQLESLYDSIPEGSDWDASVKYGPKDDDAFKSKISDFQMKISEKEDKAKEAKARKDPNYKSPEQLEKEQDAARQASVEQSIKDIPKLAAFWKEEIKTRPLFQAPIEGDPESIISALRGATNQISVGIATNEGGKSPYGKNLTNTQRQGLANDIIRQMGLQAPGTMRNDKAAIGDRLSLKTGDL